MRPRTLKESVERIMAGQNQFIAIPEFLDEFYLSSNRQPMIDEEPGFTGMELLDAYVGAIGEHLARRWGLTIPLWVEDSRRFLDTPFFPDNLQLMKPVLLQDSPIAFRRRLIFTEAEPLRRGRFPRE